MWLFYCCSVEAQRDEAVQNFLEAQSALEDFQRRNHERMKKVRDLEGGILWEGRTEEG